MKKMAFIRKRYYQMWNEKMCRHSLR